MKKVIFAMVMMALVLALAAPSGAIQAQDPVKIEVWIAFSDYRLDWVKEVAEEFNAMFPQYQVNIVGGMSYEEMFAQVSVAAEQNALPGVIHFNEASTQDARDSGNFKPIAQALGDRTEVNGLAIDFDDIIEPTTAYYTLDGNWTSFPWNTSSAIWFSNMNFVNAAGFDTPPATWADVDEYCAGIMALDNAPEYCWTFPNYGWFFEQWLAQQDALFVNNDNGRADRATEVAFNSDAGLAIFNWLNDQYDKGYLYYSGAQGGDSWGTVDQAYQTQSVAMAAYSSSDTTLYTRMGEENGFTTVASFLPYNQETGWTGNLIGGGSLWLVDGLTPEVEEGALTFMIYLSNTEHAAAWHQLTGYVAVRESANQMLEEEGWFAENPNQTVAMQQLVQSTVTPATSGALVGGFPAIRNAVTGATDRLFLTDEDPAGLLDKAASEANVIIEEYNLLNAP